MLSMLYQAAIGVWVDIFRPHIEQFMVLFDNALSAVTFIQQFPQHSFNPSNASAISIEERRISPHLYRYNCLNSYFVNLYFYIGRKCDFLDRSAL